VQDPERSRLTRGRAERKPRADQASSAPDILLQSKLDGVLVRGRECRIKCDRSIERCPRASSRLANTMTIVEHRFAKSIPAFGIDGVKLRGCTECREHPRKQRPWHRIALFEGGAEGISGYE
jgi:hypothetical protein